MSRSRRIQDPQSKHYLDLSPNAGGWARRFDLLAKRLKSRPSETVVVALRTLARQEGRDLDERWIERTAEFISEGRPVSAD